MRDSRTMWSDIVARCSYKLFLLKQASIPFDRGHVEVCFPPFKFESEVLQMLLLIWRPHDGRKAEGSNAHRPRSVLVRPNKKVCLFPVTRPFLENGPDPSKLFVLFYKNHRKKHCFHTFLSLFVQHPFKQQEQQEQQKTTTTSRPTDLVFGRVTWNKHIFCLGLRLI